MYKLTVVAGPNRGTSFALKPGETSIGRQSGNGVMLQSSRVSKRHCVILVEADGHISVKDQGSANGTFVNGVLTRTRDLQPGDRIGVGDFVLEISLPPARSQRAAAVSGFGNVIPMPGGGFPAGGPGSVPATRGANALAPAAHHGALAHGDPLNSATPGAAPAGQSGPAPMPKDAVGRALWYFETYVMPIFYGLNLKHQWKFLCVGVFCGFVLINLMLSIDPLLEANRAAVIAEVGRRATFMARDIAERNAHFIASRTESRADVGLAANGFGVRMALLTDLDNRILAPGARFNQYVAKGPEALAGRMAAQLFRAGRETGIWRDMGDNTWVAVEPLKVFNPQLGQNLVAGMAIVSMDTEIATMQLGEVSTVYSEVLIITLVLGGIALYIMYRLTLKPLQVLGEDLDKALKGEIPQVTHEFKCEELNVVWDLVNSTLQRIPKSGSTVDAAGGSDSGISPEDYLGIAKMISASSKAGVALLSGERKFIYLNENFEEITGIRSDSARGQEVGTVARDSSLGAFAEDLMGRTTVAGDAVSESYDFSGNNYMVSVNAVGKPGEGAKGYLFVVARSEA